ncbi:MAG: acetoacetate--CoA ligase [Nitriliruptoraceae bacterium]|nr:acetoacetate--CoA ligase [Nitriliruptoraceae bacterium]
MAEHAPGELLWSPPPDAWERSRMGRFLTAAAERRGRRFASYHEAWSWSVEDLEGFWGEVVDQLDVRFDDPPSAVLADASMPGARWFPDATLNYAAQALARTGDAPAIVARSQTRDELVLSHDELRDQVGRAAAGLRRLGVRRGDRVVGYLPNIPETIVAFLACAAIGAVWSSCAPEFGTRAVVDRVQQIAPTVLLVVDGYRYGDKRIARHTEVAEIRAALPSLAATVVVPYLDGVEPALAAVPDAISWGALTEQAADLHVEPVPFDYPLYVLFSSGTTGLPKAIVHGHGGIVLEHVKMLALHHDLGPGDRFFWFTTTGWMMWNYLVSGLLVGATVVLFDGDPRHPDGDTLWRLAAETRVEVFGVGAPFLIAARKAGATPGRDHDLTALRSVGSTGSPLPPEAFAWVYDAVGEDLVLASASGGTDVCTAFVGATPLTPVHAGEIPVRCLGAKVEAVDATGRPVLGERGELVITAPMPSMPVGFWNDPDGSRYRAAYFEDFPGLWRHGDWLEITPRGSCIITGRSDATLNRGGVRMGTSEFYSVVEAFEEVADSLVVHLDDPAFEAGRLLLFVRLAAGATLDDDLQRALAGAIRAELSPRHVPDEVHAVAAIPRTISGKKLEVPVKRLFEGAPIAEVANPGALQDPTALDDYAALARRR